MFNADKLLWPITEEWDKLWLMTLIKNFILVAWISIGWVKYTKVLGATVK